MSYALLFPFLWGSVLPFVEFVGFHLLGMISLSGFKFWLSSLIWSKRFPSLFRQHPCTWRFGSCFPLDSCPVQNYVLCWLGDTVHLVLETFFIFLCFHSRLRSQTGIVFYSACSFNIWAWMWALTHTECSVLILLKQWSCQRPTLVNFDPSASHA